MTTAAYVQMLSCVQLEDGHWQQYYQERKALDHRYEQASKLPADKENQAAAAEWQEDFPLPARRAHQAPEACGGQALFLCTRLQRSGQSG